MNNSVGLGFLFSLICLVCFLVPTLAEDKPGQSRRHPHCEKYCHTDCKSIPDKYHKDQCEEVHRHDSGCHCHFGGTALGIFIFVGLATVLFLMCCVCRHCRKYRSKRTTNIVVVAHPETITTISQQGYDSQSYMNNSQQQQVYSIEMSPQQHFRHQHEKGDTGNSAVTVITSTKIQQPTTPETAVSLPSNRVYFEKEATRKTDSDESIFTPPRY